MHGLFPAPPEFVFLTSSQGSLTLLVWDCISGTTQGEPLAQTLACLKGEQLTPRWPKTLIQLHLLRNCLKSGQGTRLRIRYEGGLCANSNGTHSYFYLLIRKQGYQLDKYVCVFNFIFQLEYTFSIILYLFQVYSHRG